MITEMSRLKVESEVNIKQNSRPEEGIKAVAKLVGCDERSDLAKNPVLKVLLEGKSGIAAAVL